jgi:hypothetical protein
MHAASARHFSFGLNCGMGGGVFESSWRVFACFLNAANTPSLCCIPASKSLGFEARTTPDPKETYGYP